MRRLRSISLAIATALATFAAARAGTLGDPRIGFSAERILVFDGKTYIGPMWSMPGEQRHEQALPAVKAAFILHADDAVAEILLPSLHTAVELRLPAALAALSSPTLLGKPIGRAQVDGIATTEYRVAKTIPEGRLDGSLWLSPNGIPMRADGSFTGRTGRVSRVHWELRHVEIGPQAATLFEVPPGYTRISPEAAGTLLGLRLAPNARH
jgi:hypothetical protein